jgi:hypothetical protein
MGTSRVCAIFSGLPMAGTEWPFSTRVERLRSKLARFLMSPCESCLAPQKRETCRQREQCLRFSCSIDSQVVIYL